MQIRIVASRMMKAGEVRKWSKRLKSDMDQLQLMLDLQIQIRNEIQRLKELDSNRMVA
ncbi:hypothetical protein M670_00176 [Schinkia azotoformans MEV2011]|uniref:Uncharacterized protein n=1 Tax=Schinkia azotoformans MEV2011 TaxID=1348973 RepID=A0A072P3X6_SCHAZ|nr:hypothetical protein [Schinkia azotoformans]KEF40160.1 hypothetical protein M670_00176 [Schinkia azotoformans MEV2011]